MKLSKISLLSGFTLIEMLVTVSIMVMFSMTLVAVFLATERSGTKSQLLQKVHQDGDFAIESMTRTIRLAEQVDCYGGGVSLTDAKGGVATYSLVVDQGVTKIASNSSYFLTSEEAEVSDLNFTCFDSQMGNQVVTVKFTLTAGADAGSQTQERQVENFATSISTRTY